MKRSVGLSSFENVVSWSMPARTPALSLNLRSDAAVGGSWRLKPGASSNAGTPTVTASAISGAVRPSVRAPGARSANRAVEWRMNGRIVGSVRIAASNDGGVLEIVSWMNGRATRARAPKVVSSATNIRACTSATGATSAAVSRSASTRRPSWVSGSARMRATGWRRSRAGASLPIASLSAGPRAASAFPNSTRLRWIASRVGSSNVLSTWSNSTGSGRARLSGIVAPSGIPSLESPWLISRYLSPRAERERTITVESWGSSRTSSSSLRSSRADVDPSSCWTGTTSSTRPTLTPPIRTSLLGTSAFAFGTSAEIR